MHGLLFIVFCLLLSVLSSPCLLLSSSCWDFLLPLYLLLFFLLLQPFQHPEAPIHASDLRARDRDLTRQVFGCCNPSVDTVEAVYWKSVESGTPQLTVHYAADLKTTELGSGFPLTVSPGEAAADCTSNNTATTSSSSNTSSSSSTEASVGGSSPHERQHQQRTSSQQAEDGTVKAEKQPIHPTSEYCVHPWNLARLARVEGSLLRHYHRDVPGVTSPWLYVGTVFSSFCWHTEDNFFAACNYHHWGAPKVR